MTNPRTRRRPWLWVLVDHGRGLALVRGEDAAHVIRSVVPDGQATWSTTGRGLVIPAHHVPDLVAHGQARRQLVVVVNRGWVAA